MGRTDELRNKFRNKPKFDAGLIAFADRVNEKIESRSNANVVAHGNAWVMDLYNKSIDVPAELLEKWLDSELSGVFLFENKKPIWVYEPNWCFHGGLPLVFVTQFADDEEVIYVFKGVFELKDEITNEIKGKRRFYKFLIQSEGSNTVSDGIITA